VKIRTVFLNIDNFVILEERLLKNSRTKKINVSVVPGIYRVGHKKLAHLTFCTCPCDILSGVSMYIV